MASRARNDDRDARLGVWNGNEVADAMTRFLDAIERVGNMAIRRHLPDPDRPVVVLSAVLSLFGATVS
jgi:hypothetical protein